MDVRMFVPYLYIYIYIQCYSEGGPTPSQILLKAICVKAGLFESNAAVADTSKRVSPLARTYL